MKSPKRIEDMMLERGWTKYKLAKVSGVPQSTITSLLSGRVKNPSPETAAKLAETFNVTVDYLLGYTDVNLYDWVPSPQEEAQQERIAKETPSSYSHEKEFLAKIELSDDELVKQFKLSVDGRELTEKELKKLVAFLRMERSLE